MAEQEEERAGVFARIGQAIEADQKKWGGMSLDAHRRLGVAELREAFSLGGNIAQQTPYGMWATLTPGEVAGARGGEANAVGHGPYGEDKGQEAGSVYGPSHQESGHTPSPSEIADRHRPTVQESSQPSRSPSDIAANPQPSQQQEHGRDHGHEIEHSRGR